MQNINIYDVKGDISWCPGCGNYSILTSLKQALAELDIKPHQAVIVSGIGQAAKTPHYVYSNGFNGLHGRAVPPAQGIKIANKALKVIINSGDGDSYGEGGNHLIHAIRRNVDITHIVHDNQIYGLTKGQASPTTERGQKTSMQLEGSTSDALKPLALALAAGCGFVARSFSGDQQHLTATLKEAMNYKGYALVDVMQPCVAFNHINTFQWYKDRIYYLDPASYDHTDRVEAFRKSLEWGDSGIPVGIIYREEKDSYEDRIKQLKEAPPLVDRKWKPHYAERFMEDFR
jgi:2-oxoglutarate ferredoxin oxidoreductase subunit beta